MASDELARATVFGAASAAITHVFHYLRSRQKEADKLREDFQRLESKVDSLTAELDKWKEKYYALLAKTIEGGLVKSNEVAITVGGTSTQVVSEVPDLRGSEQGD